MINWIDVLLILVVVLYAAAGWRRGFIFGIIDLIAWVGSILLSLFLFAPVAIAFSKLFPSLGVWLNVVAFLFTFTFLRLVFAFICSLITRQIPNGAQNSLTNKVMGILPGAINGFITATVIALILMVAPLSDGFATQAKTSRVTNELTNHAVMLEDKMSPVLDSAINKSIAALTVEPGKNDLVMLNYTTTKFTPRADLENQMLQMINNERAKQHLPPLQMDSTLTTVARAHCQDMFQRGYFSHLTPEGRDPLIRMHDADINYTAAGENLALAQTLQIAHNGLMHSPGHRANILNPAYTKVGIGVLDGGLHGLMIAQEFTN